MISELLLISRQKMHSQMEHNLFTIDHLWTDVIKDALFEAEQRKIICDVNISILHPEQHTIYGNLRLLTSAIENIIRNALKYTKNRIFLTISFKSELRTMDLVCHLKNLKKFSSHFIVLMKQELELLVGPD